MWRLCGLEGAANKPRQERAAGSGRYIAEWRAKPDTVFTTQVLSTAYVATYETMANAKRITSVVIRWMCFGERMPTKTS